MAIKIGPALPELPGYELLWTLHVSASSNVYVALKNGAPRPVIVKVTASELPDALTVARFKLEYELLVQLASDHVVPTVGLERIGPRYAIVYPESGARSLGEFAEVAALPLGKKLALAEKIAAAVEFVHGHGILHKDLNPSNIIIDPHTIAPRLIDFGIACRLGTQALLSPTEGVEGTVSYMAPEQTGRINRGVDARSDLYALGVTLYWLFTGRLPFRGSDTLEVVHQHLAAIPVPAHEVSTWLPLPVSQIIGKLLAKDPDQRYQSAGGVRGDLELCRHAIESGGSLADFTLGASDATPRLEPSRQLYGREGELASVFSLAERVAGQRARVLCVAGEPGVGKTSFINELRFQLGEARFGAGKYRELMRHVPYSGLGEALGAAVRAFLAADAKTVATWREGLGEALGANVRIITAMVPEIRDLFPTDQELPEVSAQQERRRFEHVLRTFIASLASRRAPLVLFLDDMQWADSASLDLLTDVLGDEQLQSVLVVFAYRQDDVGPLHPFIACLESLRARHVPCESLELQGLKVENVRQLIGHLLRRHDPDTWELADLLHARTAGNPYFLFEYLRFLQDKKLLHHDAAARSWTWALGAIREEKAAENVVNLVVGRLEALSPSAKAVLKIASCLGGRFQVRDLVGLTVLAAKDLAAALLECLGGQILFSSSLNVRLLDIAHAEADFANGALADCTLTFSHDRVLSAAQLMVDAREAEDLHLRIGRARKALLADGGMEGLFQTVFHFNLAAARITDDKERMLVARLNLIAGGQAKVSAAYDASVAYYEHGIRLLVKDSWTSSPETSWQLHLGYFEAAHLARRKLDFAALAAQLMARGRDVIDKARIYEVLIHDACSQRRFEDALTHGVEALRLLQVKINPQAGIPAIIAELIRTKRLLGSRSIDDIEAMPLMDAPKARAAERLLMIMTAPAYFVRPQLFPIIVFKMVQLSAAHGLTLTSAYSYGVYGVLLCAAFGNIPLGYDYGRLGLRLLKRFKGRSLEGKVIMVFNSSVHHLRKPLRQSLPHFASAFQAALEVGDFEYAALNSVGICNYSYLSGVELAPLEERFVRYQSAIEALGESSHLPLIKVFHQAVQCLAGAADNPSILVGRVWGNAVDMQELGASKDVTTRCAYNIVSMQLAYLFGDSDGAVRFGAAAARGLEAILGTAYVPVYFFYRALALLDKASTQSWLERQRLCRQATRLARKLRAFSGHCPENYRHKILLVDGEIKRVRGDDAEALRLMDAAAEAAIRGEFWQEAALAFERAGLLSLRREQRRLAGVYFAQAMQTYRRWGAYAKVEHLQSTYGQLLSGVSSLPPAGSENLSDATVRARTAQSSGQIGREAFDLSTMLKVAQTLFSEPAQTKIFGKIMQLMLENAGAQSGCIAHQDADDGWWVAASANVNGATKVSVERRPLSYDDVPPAILSYVANSRKNVVVADARLDEIFGLDPHVRRRRVRSVLCFPLMRQEAVQGLLYLENNAAAGAFSERDVQLIAVLAAQLAVSMDSARLYEDMEARVEMRTRELSETMAQLKSTQAELIEAGKLAALGGLVAGVAHEINTPLGIGVTVASTLEHEVKTIKSALTSGLRRSQLEAFVAVVDQSASMLAQNLGIVISQVEQFKSASARKNDEMPSEFRVLDVVNSAVSAMKVQQEYQKIRFRIAGDVEAQLISYPQAMTQIVYNLVKNSVTHAFDAGAAGEVSIRCMAGQEWHTLIYSDNGRGMSEEEQRRIYEPYFSTAKSRGNSGLGMSIVYNIVYQKLGGRIECQSRVGQGTTFTITLPAKFRDRRKLSA